jgi:hypothetical protein
VVLYNDNTLGNRSQLNKLIRDYDKSHLSLIPNIFSGYTKELSKNSKKRDFIQSWEISFGFFNAIYIDKQGIARGLLNLLSKFDDDFLDWKITFFLLSVH